MNIMNNKILIVLAVYSLNFFSCGQMEEVNYDNHSSADSTYSVDIPANAELGKCNADFMSFENTNSNLFITIQHISERSIDEYIHNKDITNNTFSYNLFQTSDTAHFYKITRGNNMWSAYDLYMLKELEGRNYLINVSSDVLGQSEMTRMIKRIYMSMKTNNIKKDGVVNGVTKDAQAVSLDNKYSTNYYSILYPKSWQIQEHWDEMTDVYIGYQPEDYGFTIVRFKTNYSLSEVNTEVNKNGVQSGYRILEEKQMKVDGVKCYRTVQEVSFLGQKVKHISYTFKKDDMLYNIKFGSVKTESQETLAASIIESFHFK